MNCEEAMSSQHHPDPERAGNHGSDADLGRSGRVAPAGELDTASAARLLRLVDEAAARWREVTVDLSNVTFMDGSGLDALLAARSRVQHRGGRFRIRSPHPSVRYVLQLTQTEDAFEVETG
jgi:anti-anti-sigma factor